VNDASHEMDQVLKELRNYSSLVTKGSYYVVEDTIYDLFLPYNGIDGYHGGAASAITTFLKEDSSFEPDMECERYLFTNNPRGFLKKVR
jgi:cephalosporin hydroxylase